MKKLILLAVSLALLLSACAMEKGGEEENPPSELRKMKSTFSSLYRVLLQSENTYVLPADAEKEEEAAMVAAGFSLSDIGQTDSEKQRQRVSEKSYFYLKESLKLMENMRLVLSEDEVPEDLIVNLDGAVNRLGYQINRANKREIMKALNDGIYCVGAILDNYGKSSGACVLRLEYCLNLLEIEAEDAEGFAQALALTNSVLDELASTAGESCQRELSLMKKSVESLKKASAYHDPQLIRMKAEVMRENLKKISVLTGQ